MIKIPQFKVSSFIHLNVFSILGFIGNLAVAGRVQWISVRTSILPSFSPSVFSAGFLNWLISFSWTIQGVRDSYVDVHDRWVFWEKFPFDKMTKNYQKWSLSNVFQFFRKVKSLFLSGNSVKWKYRCSFNISRKLHTLEKSYGQK